MPLTPRQQALNAEIIRLSAQCKLDDWASFSESFAVAPLIHAALVTGRHELFSLETPRALNASECAHLYRLIAVLIETNSGLKQHAEQVAQMVDTWMAQMSGMRGLAMQIEHFANFRKIGDSE